MYNDYFGFRVAPFSATPDPQIFFNNALYQEAFATLQYGVLAKKGFVLVTGEVGTGKTTLLRKLLHSLGNTVHSVFIFNTQVNFVDLLRLILDDLALKRQADDRLSMIDTLNQYLIERHKQGHIVTVLIDEAQNLSEEALEGLRLLSNLETDTEKLLQIVLMGQPELGAKLDETKLRQLKQRITLQCRLMPLREAEIGAYIEYRLGAAGYQGKHLFGKDAVAAIARYSRGIPRLINIVADNALLAAFGRSRKEVGAELVHEVATDLRLEAESPAASRTEHAAAPEQPEPSWLREANGIPEDTWVSRLGSESLVGIPEYARSDSPRYRYTPDLFAAAVIGLVTVGGIGATLYSRQIGQYFSRSEKAIEHVPGPPMVSTADPFPSADPHSSAPPLPQPPQAADEQDAAPQPESVPEAQVPEAQQPAESEAPAERAAERSGIDKHTESARPGRKISARGETAQAQNRRIEGEVIKAIQNRAIAGVDVAVVDGTAYLDGRVATVRQRFMAERAARSVADVKHVRNRLEVRP